MTHVSTLRSAATAACKVKVQKGIQDLNRINHTSDHQTGITNRGHAYQYRASTKRRQHRGRSREGTSAARSTGPSTGRTTPCTSTKEVEAAIATWIKTARLRELHRQEMVQLRQ